MEIDVVEFHPAALDMQSWRRLAIRDADRLGDGFQAILDHADVFENAVDHPHDPTRHIDDANRQPGGQGDGADTDQRLTPQPQGQRGGADDQEAVERGDHGVHLSDDAAGQLGFFRLLADRFAGILLLEVGVREQLERGDVGVAVDDAPHQLGARLRRHHRAFLDPWHEVPQRQDVTADPRQQRDHQSPVGFGKQHQ